MVSKRTGAPAKAPAAKKVKLDPVTEKVNQIIEELKKETCEVPGPTSCRESLLWTIPHVLGLGAASDERHEHQATMANIIEKMLKDIEAKWETRIAEDKALQETAKVEKAAQSSILDGAKESLNEAHAVVENAEKQVEADLAAEKNAQKALEEAAVAVEKFDGIQLLKGKERDEYASLLKDVFEVLKLGEFESAGQQKKFEKMHLDKLGKMLRKLDIDESMIMAMGPALSKKPEERGSFGEMTLSQVEGTMRTHLESLAGELNNGEAAKAQKESEKSARQASLEAMQSKLVGSREALKSAKGVVDEFVQAESQAQEICDQKEEVVTDLEAALYSKQVWLENSQETLKAFAFLHERVAAAPEPTEVDEPMPEGKVIEDFESEERLAPVTGGA